MIFAPIVVDAVGGSAGAAVVLLLELLHAADDAAGVDLGGVERLLQVHHSSCGECSCWEDTVHTYYIQRF